MPNNDGSRRLLRIVRSEPVQPRSANAAAAARYRARKRGDAEAGLKRKPGPKRTTTTELRNRIRELERALRDRDGLLRIARETIARQISTLTVEAVCADLVRVLERDAHLAGRGGPALALARVAERIRSLNIPVELDD
jgi:hypothetical protein